jgi:hypothetical protein
MESTTLRFADAARALGGAARERGLHVPAFRSPPRIDGAHRTLRRRGEATTIAVRVRQRPWAAVLADMVEGVIVANRLSGLAADAARCALWNAVAGEASLAA